MVKMNNYAEPAGERGGNKWYRWRVFVDEPEPVLETIENVEYVLHPTFPRPNQERDDAPDKFALESSGWGEFTIVANVKYRDGHSERQTYWLDLGKGWPSGETESE